MENPLSPNFDIEAFKLRDYMIRATVSQIIKDFSMFGMEVFFEGDAEEAYEQLFHQLEGHIVELLSKNSERLYNLLYHIDISEYSIEEALRNQPNSPLSAIIAEMIIHRE